MTMTEIALLNIIKKVPPSKTQELYDFARFLVDNYSTAQQENRIAAFESEDEMIDFINDVGRTIYAD
jgi:hypothetical protein